MKSCRPISFSVALVPKAGEWTLDLDAVRQAVTSQTRLLIVNAPNNPTGWTLTRDEQAALLAHCRSTGTWRSPPRSGTRR